MISTRCFACLSVFVLVLTCVFVTIGMVGLIMGPDILENQVKNQLPLSPDSDQVSSWEVPPVPIYLQFWLWECVNTLDVLQGAKPMLIQRGPFTYLEHRQKQGVAFNENNTITYRQPISYTFLRNMSVADDEMVIKMINAPVVTMVSLIRNQKKWIQDAFDIITRRFGETLFVSHTVREWLWGYEDPILKAAKNITILQPYVPDDHFGYFYGQNATDDGLYTVFTGKDNIDLLNNINKWNGVSYLSFWKTKYSNQINGTDGSWFPPLYKKDLKSERLYLYSTDVCRSLYAKFEDHSSVLGIPTEIFSIPAELFVNATVNPDNAPFGLTVTGVFNVSTCRQDAPIFISFPHFLYADDQVTKKVDGINPDASVHRTLFEVEPHTGLVLRAEKRLQINVYVSREDYVDDFKHITNVILPAIWINESTIIDQKSADDLNNQVLRLFDIAFWGSIGFIVLGVVLFIITIVLFVRRRSRSEVSTPLLFAESRNTIAQHDEYN